MTTQIPDNVATAISDADPATAAAIAVAVISRIGEHGLEAGEAFGAQVVDLIAEGEGEDVNFQEGCMQIADHLI